MCPDKIIFIFSCGDCGETRSMSLREFNDLEPIQCICSKCKEIMSTISVSISDKGKIVDEKISER